VFRLLKEKTTSPLAKKNPASEKIVFNLFHWPDSGQQ
jgi:hypothetical protein